MDQRNTTDLEKKKNQKSNSIARVSVIFSFLLSSVLGSPKADILSNKLTDIGLQTEYSESSENINKVTIEQVIKTSVRESLREVKSLYDFPKTITYSGVNVKNLPQIMDINPKTINKKKPIEIITITLGNRSFHISPSIGAFEGMILSPEALVLQTTFHNVKYDRQEKLPALFRSLWNTPPGKGEKKGFFLAKVVEV